ncbi:MAG: PAS domain S-box protein [Burkholderiaceae bacterium]
MTGVKRPLTAKYELRAFKWLALAHGLGIVTFFALMITFFWYLRHIETEGQQQAMYRDIEWAQRTMRLRWRDLQDELSTHAADWAAGGDGAADPAPSVPGIPDFLSRNPDVVYLAMVDARRQVRWVLGARGAGPPGNRLPGTTMEDSAGFAAQKEAQTRRRPTFSDPLVGDRHDVVVEMHVPVLNGDRFDGTMIVAFSLERTMYTLLSREVLERYQLSIVDARGDPLAGTAARTPQSAALSYELPLDPPGHGLRLRAYGFAVQSTLIERTLLTAVAGLAIAGLVTLILLWRNARRRVAAEVERDRLFTLSLDLMAVMRLDGSFVRVNPAFGQTLGSSARAERLLDLAHPDDRERIHAAMRPLQAPGAVAIEFEARFRAAGAEDRAADATDGTSDATDAAGAWRWLHWSLRNDPEPGARTIYAVAHDTTRRKQAETALAAETAFRRAMDDSMLTGMRATDLQGRITFVNRAFCKMLGFDSAELVGQAAPYPYWPLIEQDEHARHLSVILRGESPAGGFKMRAWRKDGSTIDVRMYVSPLVDSRGQQTGWMTSMTDITEPNRIREELAAAHERFTTVLDELDASVSVMPIPGAPSHVGPDEPADELMADLLFANRHYRRTFGDSPRAHQTLVARMAPAAEWAFAEVFHPEVGRWFEVRSRHIRWVDGSLVQMLVSTDVTRRREAEDQHREQAEKLQQTSRLVTMGEMASSLAHELNQPLTAIANYCNGLSARVKMELAQGAKLDPQEMLGALSKTAAQAERAGMVISRIRQFVKRSEPERRTCEVEAIVAEAVGLAEIDAQRQSVAIKVHLAPALPPVQADPILIEQVLLNLMKNGIDAMRRCPRRELDVTVGFNGRQFEFAVADSGHGLAPEIVDKLFEPFFTTKSEGMGMGLNICRSIIESHQGRLWADANPGGGCVFRFTLPALNEIAHAA